MKCEICLTNKAVIQIQQIIKNEKKRIKLCSSCAKLLGIVNKSREGKTEISIANLLTGFLNITKKKKSFPLKTCEKCGTTAREIIKSHRVGCEQCYTVFHKEVNEILSKKFGNAQHRGKYPKQFLAYKDFLFDIENLKKQLETALRSEDYENAAILRDKIKKLKNACW